MDLTSTTLQGRGWRLLPREESDARTPEGNYFSSIISRTTLRFVLEAAALRIVRIDLAVLPCLPMIRPKSSFATLNSTTEAASPSVSLTSTASGLFTKDLARY